LEDKQMDVMQAIRERRSVRAYQDKPIPDALLTEILEAARLAPSGSNRQEWRFIAVKDAEQRRKLANAAGQPFVGEAPAVIAGVSLNPTRMMSCQVPNYAVDVAIAMTSITLAAAARGLGTCWIGAFNQEEAKKVLHIPPQYKIVELMPVGYPADQPGQKSRKPFAEVVAYDTFQSAPMDDSPAEGGA